MLHEAFERQLLYFFCPQLAVSVVQALSHWICSEPQINGVLYKKKRTLQQTLFITCCFIFVVGFAHAGQLYNPVR